MGELMEFKTKDFTILTPFSIVTKNEATVTDLVSENVIKIAGMANFSGIDEYGKTYVDITGDIVVPSGVDTSAWGINPQILWQHNRDETIGEGILLEKRPDGIYIECNIHKGAMEEKDWYRIKSGLVKMFSIGFRTLDAEYKTIDGDDVYFITRSLLLEVSVVSIPANSRSSFSQIKSLDGGFTSSREDFLEEVNNKTHSENEEELTMNIKLKRADLLTEADLDTFKSLGGNTEEEVEVGLSDFIKSIVAREVADILAAKESAQKEAEAKAQEEAEAKAQEEAELKAAEEAKLSAEAEAAKLEEAKEMEAELVELKALIDELRSLATEEK